MCWAILWPFLFDLILPQIITDSTNTHGGVLDLVFKNRPESVIDITIDSSSPNVSDQYMILFDRTIDEVNTIQADPDGHSATLEQAFRDF